MKFVNPDIDHIDPQWREGRDYQLVCGLNTPLNYCERESKFNTAKTNRFLPWRVALDEIGTVPVNQGDLCLFLDPDTNTWVLEEFLGEWWFTKTKHFAGGCVALDKWRQDNLESQIANLVNWQRANAGETTRKQWVFYNNNPDKLAQRNANIGAGVRRRDEEDPSIRQRIGAGIREAKKRRFKCLQTGYVGNGSAVSQYQIKHGIDHKNPSNRIRLE